MNTESRSLLGKSVFAKDVLMVVGAYFLKVVLISLTLFSAGAFVVSCSMGGWIQPVALLFATIVVIVNAQINAQSNDESLAWREFRCVAFFLAAVLLILAGVANVRQALDVEGLDLSMILFTGSLGAFLVAGVFFAVAVFNNEEDDLDCDDGYSYC